MKPKDIISQTAMFHLSSLSVENVYIQNIETTTLLLKTITGCMKKTQMSMYLSPTMTIVH